MKHQCKRMLILAKGPFFLSATPKRSLVQSQLEISTMRLNGLKFAIVPSKLEDQTKLAIWTPPQPLWEAQFH